MPSTNSIRIKSFYNNENIAFLLEWDDRTNEQAETYSDAVAIQFPTKIPEGLKKPYFAMGDSGNGVELLHWKAYDESVLVAQSADDIETETDGGESLEEQEETDTEGSEEIEVVQEDEGNVEETVKEEFKGFFKIKEMNAKGFKRLSVQPDNSQNSLGKSQWKNGKWQVMITRPLFTADKKTDVQFVKGKLIPYALAVWDGSNSEIKGQKAISSWYYLTLEMTTPKTVYVYALVAIFMAVCIQFWVVARIRRFPTEIPSE
jgi:DMSO reductase family type II enzyme heme b subunit